MSVLFHQGISLTTGSCKPILFRPTDLPAASAAGKLELLGAQVYLSPPENHPMGSTHQVKDGGHDSVHSLNLFLLEANDFHGISYGFELRTVVDGTLRGKRCLGHEGIDGNQL